MQWFNALVARSLPLIPKPVMRRLSSRYVAGETLDSCVRTVRDLNSRGFRATIDILGEFVRTSEEAERVATEYCAVLDRIAADRLDANISVKPTHLGLKIGRDVALAQMGRLCEHARKSGNFVRIDMEDASCLDDTYAIYQRLTESHSNVGLVMQAYLRRAWNDLRAREGRMTNFRLCKGIYREPYAVAYHDPEAVRRNFTVLLDEMFRSGFFVGIATHDELLAWEAERLIRTHQRTPLQYEFQMLLGVGERLRDTLRAAGHPIRIYVPFGADWHAYTMRRLRRNPAIVGHVMRRVFGRGG
ncbi:MAG: proline dehydrogenase family protein [Planctomycetes bacterium]|nr:proline dehydrogenase family protein [Planctomycetota bacterium]